MWNDSDYEAYQAEMHDRDADFRSLSRVCDDWLYEQLDFYPDLGRL